ncbi:hypothetical protein MUK42_16085 [Musa troglodytarum]|uniref:Uncharacterized protein n=1 Tax=Musa troglodytarum TaxID=320322 RepID=A0A9E7KY01_9LILI|nr:hypothetical protein MUK42_16085 [Musa troglodytarum]
MIPLYFSSAQTTATVDDRESRLNCFDEVATGDGLMRALLYVTDNSPLKPGGLHLSPRTGASLSIHALAAAPLGLALRKEIALLLVAAEKIPWLGAIDVSEGDSVAREGFFVSPRSSEQITPFGLTRLRNEGLRIVKIEYWCEEGDHVPLYAKKVGPFHDPGFEDHEDGGIYIGSSGIGPKRVIMSPCMPIRSDLSTTPGLRILKRNDICSHATKSIDDDEEETFATVVESLQVLSGINRRSTIGMVLQVVSVSSDIKKASTSLVKKASSV